MADPGALRGGHGVAVQLSDGSVIYAESDGSVDGNGSTSLNLWRRDTNGSLLAVDGGWTWFPYAFLQGSAIVLDSSDNAFFMHSNPAASFVIERLSASNNWSWSGGSTSGTNRAHNMAAVWCDGSARGGAGRVLVAVTLRADSDLGIAEGDTQYAIINCDDFSVEETGMAPSWLVPNSSHRNATGTGLSLATDVEGGNRVTSICYSTDGSNTETRLATFTVGSTISNISTQSLSPDFDPGGVRAKVMGKGSESWVAAWNSANGVEVMEVGGANETISEADLFDIVYSDGLLWTYYWNDQAGTELVRRAFDLGAGTLGDPILINTFADPGDGTHIRTSHRVRDERFILVDHNRDDSGTYDLVAYEDAIVVVEAEATLATASSSALPATMDASQAVTLTAILATTSSTALAGTAQGTQAVTATSTLALATATTLPGSIDAITLTPPTNLTITETTSDTISLSWDSVDAATSYHLERQEWVAEGVPPS